MNSRLLTLALIIGTVFMLQWSWKRIESVHHHMISEIDEIQSRMLLDKWLQTPPKAHYPFRCLAVIVFHNDEDIVDYQIQYMKDNQHDVLVFDHGSTDNTVRLIQHLHPDVEFIRLPKTMEFKYLSGVFRSVSYEVMKRKHRYDWVTFVESDEVLEGPRKGKRYVDFLYDVHQTPYNFIEFENFVFWTTRDDDESVKPFRVRVRHYAYNYECGPRYYAWRAKDTNMREWNHNPPKNPKLCPVKFRTNHYPCRTREKMAAKIRDRASKVDMNTYNNYHYKWYDELGVDKIIPPGRFFHLWDGKSDLVRDKKFSWVRFFEGGYKTENVE